MHVRTRHFRRKEDGIESLRPSALLFEVRLDFHDVRSGLAGSDAALYTAPVLVDPELDWTADMVATVKWPDFQELEPAPEVPWPEWADGQIIRHFLKHHRIVLLRNSESGLYSMLGESRDDFLRRCLDFLSTAQAQSLMQLRDLFLRRFLEAETRYFGRLGEDELAGETGVAREVELRDVFSGIRDRFSACFSQAQRGPLSREEFSWVGPRDVEVRERLESLRDEFVSQFNLFYEQLYAKAAQAEEYEVALSHSDIEVMSHAYLWTPTSGVLAP